MSFLNINEVNTDKYGRSFIIIYNFNAKEVVNLKNISRIFGINDIQVLSNKNANCKILDIINNDIDTSEEQGINQKLIIFNNINTTKISGLIDSLKKLRMSKPLIAMVTQENTSWTINKLLQNLLEERAALQQGNMGKH